MGSWRELLKADPVPWLLSHDAVAPRAATLRFLLERPEDDPELRRAMADATLSGPIAAILAAQQPEGYWVKPGAGYAPKYTGTVWQVIFLDQMGADRANPAIRAACEYVLSHCPTRSGGLGVSGVASEKAPSPSMVIHCLNGNLLRALIGFGWLKDERVQMAVEWEARAITGDGFQWYYESSTNGPGFCCAANEKQPCAWGAVKAMLALSRIPEERRSPQVQDALRVGGDFLLSRDPVVADYPFSSYAKKPSESWFKLGFPLGYVTDVLQNLEALCEMGCGGDRRLKPALRWLLSQQDDTGRWRNRYAYNGKTWGDIDQQGALSRWVTLRACRVLKMAWDASGGSPV